jgi:hypothetical protein
MDVFGTVRNAIELTKDMVVLIDDIRGAENEKKRLMSDTRECEQILQSLCTSQSTAVAVNEGGETVQQDLSVNALLERFHADISTLATTLRASSGTRMIFSFTWLSVATNPPLLSQNMSKITSKSL